MKLNKLLKGTLAFMVAFSSFAGTKQSVYATGGTVDATVTDEKVTIGNDHLRREFSINDGQILTSAIVNDRIDKTLVPQAGSEDFVINTLSNDESSDDDDVIENKPSWTYTKPLSTEGWSATLKNSAGTAFTNASVAKLFDHDLNTYPDEYTKPGHPFNLDINFGKEQTITGMSVNKRPGYSVQGFGTNGTMGGYQIWTSNDGKNYTKLLEGEFTKEDYNLHQDGDLYNVGDMVYVNFDAVTTQYVRVVQTSVAIGSAQEFTSAEVDFYDQEITKEQTVIVPKTVLDRTNWNVSIKNSSGIAFSDAMTAKLIDGNLSTHPDEYTKSGHPFTVDIDLGKEQTVRSLSVDKRPGFTDPNYGTNGTMGEFELYVSNNGSKWKLAGAGNFVSDAYNLHQEGNLHNVGDRVYANFYKPYTTRYVRLVQKSCSMGSADEFTTAELNLYEDQYVGPNWNTAIKPVSENAITSSMLTYAGAKVENIDGGKKVVLSYEPFEKNGVNWDIDMVVVMENGRHYMNSYLEINTNKPEEARIDYIDFDAFVLPEDIEGLWSIPDESEISSMWIGKHELMLGQPIYANGMFFGSEFPAQETDVDDETNTMKIRYYSGKTFAKMAEDNQLQKDGTLRTWNNVIGAAKGTGNAVVQTDFYSYIEDIATPTKFRKQYNSWYDNMMSITDESIASSFNGAEKGLAQNGVEPLDSYVVDDGWNNYYDGTYTATPGANQGTTPNRTGFWEFNNKFPNELYTSSALSDKLNASFGVWVGPQGGYNYFGTFSQFLESKGTGYVQSNSALGKVVCTGSRKYLNNFEDMAIDYQQRFNVDYWKWDGFASRPCNNPNHDHMTGGDKNMYFTSDMWEAWTDLFENVRAARRAEGKDLFINATCYINLSPWLLQWVNTIWVQDSGDTGQAGDLKAARHQQKIYYRDNVYYNLYKRNQVQFPLKNIYNHDPIYGVSDGSSATTEVFREFLFDNAMRGTAFWELYYSPSIMNGEKWMVTADALDFAETNHDVLKNAKLFVTEGKNPTNGVYGYSAWNNDKGFVSFVNPTATQQTYTLPLTDAYGVPANMANLAKAQVYPYTAATDGTTVSYGDEFTVTLAPFSSQIYQFGVEDTTAPKLVSAKITDTNKLQVKFNERVNVQDGTFTVNGTAIEAALLADYRTVELTVNDLAKTADVSAALSDVYGNETTVSVKARANDIATVTTKDDLNSELKDYQADGKTFIELDGQAYSLTNDGIEGTTDFAASMAINTKASDVVLMSQEDGFTVSIDKDGYVVFDVLGTSVSSKEDVTTVVEKAHGTFGTDEYVPTTTKTATVGKVNDGQTHTINAVREINGTIKLYVDGKLSASAYNKTKLNEEISKNEIILGDSEFNGYVADVKVTNSAVYYDEAQAYYDSFGLVKDLDAVNREGWRATACSQQTDQIGTGSDGSAMDVLDGKNNTYWHSNWSGHDNCTDKHWLKVDFGKTTNFDVLEYVARPGASNGTWQTVTVIGISEDGTETTIAENETVTLTNNAYRFVFAQTQSYAGVKFILTQTVGGFGSAAEISAYTNPIEMAATSDVIALQERANELFVQVEESAYTPDSYQAFVNAVNAIKDANPFATTAEDFASLETNLDTAYANLVEVSEIEETDKTALQIAVDVAETLKTDNVIPVVKVEFEAALAQAKTILADEYATQDEVDASFIRLATAIQMLSFEKGDKSELVALIKVAEGLTQTDYTKASWANLVARLDEARGVAVDENAMQEEIDETVKALKEAIDGLVKLADKSKLLAFYNRVKDTEEAKYLANTWGPFKDALANADAVLKAEEPTQAEVDNVYNALVKAFLDLRLKPNKDLLGDLINKAAALNEPVLANVIASAKVVFDNPEATQAEVDNATKALEQAINGLVKPSNKKPSVATGDNSAFISMMSLTALSLAGLWLSKKRES